MYKKTFQHSIKGLIFSINIFILKIMKGKMGRPRGKKITASMTIYGTQKEINTIKRQAKKEMPSISRYCINKLLEEDKKKEG